MYPLSEKKFQVEALPALKQIFAHEDPWNKPFATNVEIRRLLYPVSTTLRRSNPELLDALFSSAKKLGDKGFFLSLITRPPAMEQDRPYHWYYPFTDMSGYESSKYAFAMEQVLYSPTGQWGMMISFEDHALLGSSIQFFDTLQTILPDFDNIKQVQKFLANWKYYKEEFGPKFNTDITWISVLLTHIYGAAIAQGLIEESGLTGLI
jgi:hypothetical protein